jgi:hypothetical protein
MLDAGCLLLVRSALPLVLQEFVNWLIGQLVNWFIDN